jgi:hypothetical protein
MLFIATSWAAALNLIFLVTALAWTPAFWQQPVHWLQALPWRTFASDLDAMLQMQPADAGAAWTLWLCASAALLLGALGFYALLKLRAPAAAAAPLPTPEVAAMFGQLSGSFQGLEGFGDPKAPVLSVPMARSAEPVGRNPAAVAEAPAELDAPSRTEVPAARALVPVSPEPRQDTAPAALAASLQEIDPELGSSYDALLRELGSVARAK